MPQLFGGQHGDEKIICATVKAKGFAFKKNFVILRFFRNTLTVQRRDRSAVTLGFFRPYRAEPRYNELLATYFFVRRIWVPLYRDSEIYGRISGFVILGFYGIWFYITLLRVYVAPYIGSYIAPYIIL